MSSSFDTATKISSGHLSSLLAPRAAAMLVLSVALLACAEETSSPAGEPYAAPVVPAPASEAATTTGPALRASAAMQSEGETRVSGTVEFEQVGGEVAVTAHLAGLPPGAHGFHIHQNGDCSGEGFASAGSHFDPSGQPHGAPGTAPHHAGDLGNLEAAADGTAHHTLSSSGISLSEGERSILGRAVIVHADRDQFTQPDGAAGKRIACGVVVAVPTS